MTDMTLPNDQNWFCWSYKPILQKYRTANGCLCDKSWFILCSANNSFVSVSVSVSVSADYGNCLLDFSCCSGVHYLQREGKKWCSDLNFWIVARCLRNLVWSHPGEGLAAFNDTTLVTFPQRSGEWVDMLFGSHSSVLKSVWKVFDDNILLWAWINFWR
jgi:hypothetical protein